MILALAAVLSLQVGARGGEYFVGKNGSDANNGASRETAFLTIQKGIDTLQSGDTLTIGPGEYSENVFRADLGTAETDTLICAEITGTVLLRGDIPVPEFEKVEGYRFVYAAPCEQEPEAVLERTAMKLLEQKPNISEVEFEPGAFFYDREAGRLYISSDEQKDPRDRLFTLAVSGKSGLHLERPNRVTIEGLSATGFYRAMARRPGYWVDDYQWGIVLDRPTSCAIRDCCAFLNLAGIGLNNGRGNVVENCLAHDNSAHNIQYFGGDENIDNVARNCRAYRGEWGIDSYTTFSGPVHIENCVAWNHFMDYSTKGTNSAEFAFLEGCVALSDIRIHNMKNCIFGGSYNEYNRDGNYTSDTIDFSQEENLDINREFADPINMDWRLQEDSRFRGAREDGKDRGVFPEHDYRVFFLSTNGNDENNGTSYGNAWQSFGRAVRDLQPGDTLYIYRGVYETGNALSLGRADGKKIKICGRGRDRVVIRGLLNLLESSSVDFERVHLPDNVNVKGGEGIEFTNCNLGGLSIDAVKGLKVTHTLFENQPLNLSNTSGVYLSGNIYANAAGPAVVLDGETEILYSDYNSYQNAAQCWAADGAVQSLDDMRDSHDRYSQILTPDIPSVGGVPKLVNDEIFAGRGPSGTSLGRHQEYEEKTPSIVGPFLHSVSDTTANIEWWTSGPTTCEIAWGDTPEMENSAVSVNNQKVSSVTVQTYRFTSFSLTNLKPGQKYYFAIRSVRPVTAQTAMPLPTLRPKDPPLTFTTEANPLTPKTYYVAPDGSDASTGLSRDEAWKTVGHAAAQVNAGDTVMIAAGTYKEMVRLRASGAADNPITFRCVPGEKVILDGDERRLANAFVLNKKQNVHLDGLYFTNYATSVIAVFGSDGVRITRCFSDGRGPGYAGPLLIVRDSSDIVVRNCVSIDGFGEGIYIAHVDGMLIEHNVFLRNLIFAFVLENSVDEKVVMRKNICTDSLPFKSQVPNFSIENIKALVEQDNCYYMRLPDEERAMFQFYGDTDLFGGKDRVGLLKYQETVGDTGSYLGNPWFKGTVGMEEGETVQDRGRNYPVILSDKLVNKPDLDFSDLFATDPNAVEKEIGLVPTDFQDFDFEDK